MKLEPSPRKKFYLNLRNRFLDMLSSIRSKNTFRTNINEDNFFFKLEVIFLLIKLHMYLCSFGDIHFLNLKKKNNQEIFLNQKNISLTV